jgi:polysaccharide export outer membrane protein
MRSFIVILLGCACLWAQSAQPVVSNLPAQKIGANDLIAVSVYDSPEFTRTLRVGSDGLIRLPMLKQRIKVDGLMPQQVETAIAEALQAEGLLVDPYVTVTVAEYHSRPISVMGAVKRPTTFQAEGPTTLLEALSRAEGLTAEAGPEILVSRTQTGPDGAPAAQVQRIPVKALIDAADPEMNLPLAGGEEIRVPEAGKVFVVGNVKKPGAFPLQDNSEISILKALALSEGLTAFAAKQAFIYRREGNGAKNEIPIELKKIMDRKAPDVPLLANDILYIPDRSGKRAGLAACADRPFAFSSDDSRFVATPSQNASSMSSRALCGTARGAVAST